MGRRSSFLPQMPIAHDVLKECSRYLGRRMKKMKIPALGAYIPIRESRGVGQGESHNE